MTQDAIGRGCDETLVGGVGECVKEHLDCEGRATERGHGGTLTLDALPTGDDCLSGVVLDDVRELVDRNIEILGDFIDGARGVEQVGDGLADEFV